MDHAKVPDKEPTAREQITVFSMNQKTLPIERGTVASRPNGVHDNQKAIRINHLGRADWQALNMVLEDHSEALDMALDASGPSQLLESTSLSSRWEFQQVSAIEGFLRAVIVELKVQTWQVIDVLPALHGVHVLPLLSAHVCVHQL
ncbi:MAG: hypothetical protein ACJ0GY_06910 [Synechococcus sp.]